MEQPNPKAQFDHDLVQLARLALTGRRQDVQLYVQRLARRYKVSVPNLASGLTDLLRESPSPQSPLRREAPLPIPVDTESRLQLLRFEDRPALETEPIWAPEVDAALHQIVTERRKISALQTEGLLPTRTVVFTGPPGVGKTLAARWIARELSRTLVTLDLSAVMSSFLGRTGANIRQVLDYAKGTD